jgi:hypothetical protein
VAKACYPGRLREKARKVYSKRRNQGPWRGAKLQVAITWRTCPVLTGRAVLEETNSRKLLADFTRIEGFSQANLAEKVKIKPFVSMI